VRTERVRFAAVLRSRGRRWLDLFWLSDAQWMVIGPFIRRTSRALPRGRSEIISGIMHVIRSGCRSRDCPPPTGHPRRSNNRSTVVAARLLARACWQRWRKPAGLLKCLAGLDLHQGASLSPGWQRGGQSTGDRCLARPDRRPRSTSSPTSAAVIHLTPGNASDVTTAREVIDAVPDA